MLAKRLDVMVYEKDGRRWKNHVARNPTWTQIMDSIKKLDRHCYPWVLIRLTEDESDDNYMTVMGGKGAYWLGISVKGYDQRKLLDPAKGNKEIDVWTSDQGFSTEECRVSFDLEAVLNAARYFSEHADCDPSLPWEPKS